MPRKVEHVDWPSTCERQQGIQKALCDDTALSVLSGGAMNLHVSTCTLRSVGTLAWTPLLYPLPITIPDSC